MNSNIPGKIILQEKWYSNDSMVTAVRQKNTDLKFSQNKNKDPGKAQTSIFAFAQRTL